MIFHRIFIVIIMLITSLGQSAADLYLPSLPGISQHLMASTGEVQLTISLYIFGFAFSQLFYGPISDGIGRKIPLLAGLIIFFLGSLLCSQAVTIHQLMLGRLLQGLGSGCGITLCRSMLRDRYEGSQLAKLGSYLAIGIITTVASAPLLGGYTYHLFGWRANFIFLTAYALVLIISVITQLPETNQHRHVDHLRFHQLQKSMKTLLTSPTFLGFSFIVALTYGSILAWVTVTPILLQFQYGITPVKFGWVTGLIGFVSILGCLFNIRLLNKLKTQQILILGLSLMLTGGFIMLLLSFSDSHNAATVIGPLLILMFGTSLVFSNSFAGALSPFAKIAGLANSLFSFIQILGGALASTLLAYCNSTHPFSLATALTCFAGLGLLSYFGLVRRKINNDSA